MMGKELSILFHVINHMISLVMPKSKYIWVYGEWFGEKFYDNSYYAFNVEPIDFSRKPIRKIWITKNKEVYELIRHEGKRVLYAYSLLGLYYQARAKVFFCTVNSRDFCFSSLTPRAKIFQLWHGLPLKKIGFDVKQRSGFHVLLDRVRAVTTDRYSYIASPSKEFDSIFCSAFRVPSKKILRINAPRCDGLFEKKYEPFIRNKLDIRTKNVLFFLPTHREEGRAPDKIRGLIDDMRNLRGVFEDLDITLIIKPHFYEAGNFIPSSSGNIKIVKDLPLDLYKCLSISSGIITDYSSVSLDFGLTGRPVFFYTPDLDEYIEGDRELYFDFDEIMEDYSKSLVELEESIRKYFISGIAPTGVKIPLPKSNSSRSISQELQQLAEEKIFGYINEKK